LLKRFEEVSVETKGRGRCDHAALAITTSGLKTSGCHEADVDVSWSQIERVCYIFGFRGTFVIRTAGKERRILTTTPAELKSVRDAVRSRSPKTREITGCR